jgi:hypothetical protein
MAGITGVDGIHGEATGFIGGLSKQGRIHGKKIPRVVAGAERAKPRNLLPFDKPPFDGRENPLFGTEKKTLPTRLR